jgi:hypothetical protein
MSDLLTHKGYLDPDDFQQVLALLREGSSHSDAALFRVLFEQVEANRKAIKELRAEYEDHAHYADGPYERTRGPH